jgi:tetratricopeptide (TPR) repeat protein
VVVGTASIGEPLAPGLAGRHQITEEQALQGWARPGARAVVLATVGGDETKAVAFAYDKGDAMPGGLEAVHRRGAFLAYGDANGQLNAEGWRLFEMVAKGVVEGGRWTESPSSVGLWFLQDGKPTRSLSAQEYRDWVNDQISDSVYKRLRNLGAIFGSIGVGGIIVLLFGLYANVQSFVTEKLKKDKEEIVDQTNRFATAEIDKQGNSLKTELERRTASAMAEMLFSKNSEMKNAIEKHLKERGAEKFQELLGEEGYQKDIVSKLNALIDENGTLTEKLFQQYDDPRTTGKKRRMALQLAYLYAEKEKHKVALRERIKNAILNFDEHEGVRTAALEIYEPYGQEEKDRKELETIVAKFAKVPLSLAMTQSFGTFISTFSDSEEHVEFLLNWLIRENKVPTVSFNPDSKDMNKGKTDEGKRDEGKRVDSLFLSIAGLKAVKKDDPQVLRLLVEYAVDKQDANKRAWGIYGLLLTRDNLQLTAGIETRKELVQKLLARINEIYFPGKVDEQGTFGNKTKNAQDLGPCLTVLLRSEDSGFVASSITAGNSDSVALQELLKRYTERLQLENKTMPKEVAEKLFEVGDLFVGDGCKLAIEHLLLRGVPDEDGSQNQKFLQMFLMKSPDWLPPSKNSFRHEYALRLAIEKDAKSRPPFDGTQKLLETLAMQPKNDHTILVDAIKKALSKYCYGPRTFDDIENMRVVLERHDQAPLVRDVLMPAYEQLQKNVLRRVETAKNWDLALRVYDSLIRHDSTDPEWRNRQGLVYLKRMDRDEAIGDFVKAIELRDSDYRYWENLGLAYRSAKQTKPTIQIKPTIKDYKKAIEYYKKAIEKLDMQENKPTDIGRERARLHKTLGLLHVLIDDEKGATEYTKKAVAGYKIKSDKAGCQVNLGLLFLRKKKWKEAFDNTTHVNQFDQSMPWNWIIRYIAARESDDEKTKDEADGAMNKWLSLHRHNDLATLNLYIEPLLKKHLNVREVIPGRLEGKPYLTTRFGKSITNSHPFTFEAGKKYIIDMESDYRNGDFDSYLILKDPSNESLDENDDSGGDRNARITFTAKITSDKYQVIATSFGGHSQGAYSLIIREADK